MTLLMNLIRQKRWLGLLLPCETYNNSNFLSKDKEQVSCGVVSLPLSYFEPRVCGNINLSISTAYCQFSWEYRMY